MTDEHNARDEWFDAEDEPAEEITVPEEAIDANDESDLAAEEVAPVVDQMPDEDGLLTAEQFDDELARLETEDEGTDDEYVPDETYATESTDEPEIGEMYADDESEDEDLEDLEAVGEEERLRGPRAQAFRQRLRTQVSLLPLALFLIALGGFLLAREQDMSGLPDFTSPELAGLSVLAVATTMVIHALLSGRRERGLLFVGLWVWVTAGVLAALVYGIDEHPDAREWWPVLLWGLAITLLVTYLVERTHDVRLVLLSTVILAAGAIAYWVTSERINQEWLDRAEDYWPLLFSVLGVVLLPLAFRRRIG